jgi:predicted ATP-binding protein involved in virulence
MLAVAVERSLPCFKRVQRSYEKVVTRYSNEFDISYHNDISDEFDNSVHSNHLHIHYDTKRGDYLEDDDDEANDIMLTPTSSQKMKIADFWTETSDNLKISTASQDNKYRFPILVAELSDAD